tara:strand:+ start:455 stop:751 length:297 start_codon:yes stop_codon:yes gene_type:complete
MLKIITAIFFLLFLNGCIQSSAFLGPIFTGASTGSAYQAGLSYGSSQFVTKITGKSPTENVKSFLDQSKEDDSENANDFFKSVKMINRTSGIQNLANQ